MLQALDDLGNPVGSPFPASGDGPSNVFRYTGNQYEYNLDTSALASGRYQLQALLDDGTHEDDQHPHRSHRSGCLLPPRRRPYGNPPTLFLNGVPDRHGREIQGLPPGQLQRWEPLEGGGHLDRRPVAIQGVVAGLSPLHVWLGLRNSDDVGTQFDVRAEVHTAEAWSPLAKPFA